MHMRNETVCKLQHLKAESHLSCSWTIGCSDSSLWWFVSPQCNMPRTFHYGPPHIPTNLTAWYSVSSEFNSQVADQKILRPL